MGSALGQLLDSQIQGGQPKHRLGRVWHQKCPRDDTAVEAGCVQGDRNSTGFFAPKGFPNFVGEPSAERPAEERKSSRMNSDIDIRQVPQTGGAGGDIDFFGSLQACDIISTPRDFWDCH